MSDNEKMWDAAYMRSSGVYRDADQPNHYTIQRAEPSGWRCEMFGMGQSMVLFPKRGNVPNAFWRWMQRICLGNKWSKVE